MSNLQSVQCCLKTPDRYVICAQIWTFLVFFVLSLATMVWYVGADAWLGVKVQGLGEALDAAVFDSSLYINNTIVQVREQNRSQKLSHLPFLTVPYTSRYYISWQHCTKADLGQELHFFPTTLHR